MTSINTVSEALNFLYEKSQKHVGFYKEQKDEAERLMADPAFALISSHRLKELAQHVPKSGYATSLLRSIEILKDLSPEEIEKGEKNTRVHLSKLSNFLDTLVRRGRKALCTLRKSRLPSHHKNFLDELRKIIKVDDMLKQSIKLYREVRERGHIKFSKVISKSLGLGTKFNPFVLFGDSMYLTFINPKPAKAVGLI